MSNSSPTLYEHQVNIYYPDGDEYAGGNISNVKIVDNIPNNLYPDVQEYAAIMGIPHECRCVFIRNDSDVAKTAKVTAWTEVNTPCPTTRVKFGIGGSGVNAAEIELGTPFSVPSNVDFQDINSMPSEPQILELDPHQYFAIWFDWIIDPNTDPYIDDFFVLSVEVERQPDSLATTNCPEGYTYNGSTGLCVPNSVITCPSGQVLDPATGTCITPIVCDADEVFDPVSRTCIPINQNPTCPTGQHYNPTTQRCEDDVVNPPPAGTINDVDIVAGGDWDCTSDTDETIQTCLRIDPDLLLGLGDYSYRSTETCFINLMKMLTKLYPSKMKMTIGNHEDTEDGSAENRQEIINAFGMPSNGYYAFTLENIRFIAMDTQKSLSSGSAQHTFVLAQLQQADSDPFIKWKVVFCHKPSVVAGGEHHGAETTLRNVYHPLFDLYHVNLMVAGHNHNFSATHFVNHANGVTTPNVLDTDGNYSGNGMVFVTAGNAGTDLRSNSGAEHIAYANDTDFGVLHIGLRSNGTKLVCNFAANDGTNKYTFTINK